MVLAQAVPSFLYTGSYGSLSDLYGRKPVLALPVVGMAVYAAGLLVIQQYEPQEYIAIAIGCSFINGCCGGILVYVMAAYAYVSDATRTAVSIRRSVYSLTHGKSVIIAILHALIAFKLSLYDVPKNICSR